jgi:hypothetical protein
VQTLAAMGIVQNLSQWRAGDDLRYSVEPLETLCAIPCQGCGLNALKHVRAYFASTDRGNAAAGFVIVEYIHAVR